MKKDKNLKTAKSLAYSSDEEKVMVKRLSAATSSSDDEEANADLSLEVIKKAEILALRSNSRATVSPIVTHVVDYKKKKMKRKSKKSVLIQTAEATVTNEFDEGFRDFCAELAVVDTAENEGKVEADKSVEPNPTDKTIEPNPADKTIEPNPAEVSDNAVMRKLLRGPRYFDPPNNSWGSCYNCGEEGHTYFDCTSAKRKKPCFVCGSFEHNAKQCSKGRDCYICKQQGHGAKDCPEKNRSSKICLKCGDVGHQMFVCRNEYFSDDLKDIQCYICKRFGHLCCVNYSDSALKGVSCYKCGLSGHTGLACTGGSMDDLDHPGSSKPCYRCGIEGHFARECTSSTKACTVSSDDLDHPGSAKSCYRCGVEGHFARECTSSTKACTGSQDDLDYPGSAKSCYKCGVEGHFARECTSSVKDFTSSLNRIDIPGSSTQSCYKCGVEGHIARECSSSTKTKKRSHDLSTPKVKSVKKSRHHLEVRSAPHDLGKIRKKKKSQNGEYTPPVKTKRRGGWITDDPREEFHGTNVKQKSWRSPATPKSRGGYNIYGSNNHTSDSHPLNRQYTPKFMDSIPTDSSRYYQPRFSASYYGDYSNDWSGRHYNSRR